MASDWLRVVITELFNHIIEVIFGDICSEPVYVKLLCWFSWNNHARLNMHSSYVTHTFELLVSSVKTNIYSDIDI